MGRRVWRPAGWKRGAFRGLRESFKRGYVQGRRAIPVETKGDPSRVVLPAVDTEGAAELMDRKIANRQVPVEEWEMRRDG